MPERTFQQWIAQNLYAESIPRRSAALSVKIVLEVFTIAFLALVFSLIIDWVLTIAEFSIPALSEPWPVIFVFLTGAGMRKAWCFLSETS